MICDNISISTDGRLLFAGQDTAELAREYGTPLYLMDEQRIRRNCRIYKEAFRRYFPEGSAPAYASKAASFKRMYEIMAEEGMYIDVVSVGEINTACRAGFDLSHAFFHCNNKTDYDIAFAMDRGLGYFVVDNFEELYALEAEAERRGIRQKILLRLTPGIDPHTYEAISTGKVDSKFGVSIETGQAEEFFRAALEQSHLDLRGFHCHVGSQVFAEDVFERSAEVMLSFIARLRESYGFETELLNLGGGYGVRYVESDPFIDIDEKLRSLSLRMNALCKAQNIPVPMLHMEPGRSIVADAGMTLYTAGSVKIIPGYKSYVSIDGGMSDNPRQPLYGAKYTCLAAGRMNERADFLCSLVGRCCESGDIIQEHIYLPSSVRRGDLIAVCTTGAYNYSMASNYNRIPRPPVVMLSEGRSYVAVRRETPDDLCQYDL